MQHALIQVRKLASLLQRLFVKEPNSGDMAMRQMLEMHSLSNHKWHAAHLR